MTETTATPAGPTTEQLVAALAASLLPLAGPTGIAVASLIPAVEQLLARFRSQDAPKNYTVEELAAIVASGNTHLADLKRDVDALGDAKP